MKNYFMFVDGVDKTYAYSADTFLGLNTTGDGLVTMWFKNLAGGTVDLDADEVVLTVTSDSEKAVVLAILKQSQKGTLLVADDVAGEYCHSDILSVAVTIQV